MTVVIVAIIQKILGVMAATLTMIIAIIGCDPKDDCGDDRGANQKDDGDDDSWHRE